MQSLCTCWIAPARARAKTVFGHLKILEWFWSLIWPMTNTLPKLSLTQYAVSVKPSLLAEVSHGEANWNERRETSAGFRRVIWWSHRPNFWSKLTGFQNWFCLMCNARALLDCTLTIIEPTVDYGFHEIREFRNFLLWSSHKTVCFYAWMIHV